MPYIVRTGLGLGPMQCCADAQAAAVGGCDPNCMGPLTVNESLDFVTGKLYEIENQLTNLPAKPGETSTDWLNRNGKTLAIGAGVLFGVVFLSKMMR